MKIKTFELSYLQGTKAVLKSVFSQENSDEAFNEWEFDNEHLQILFLNEILVYNLRGCASRTASFTSGIDTC